MKTSTIWLAGIALAATGARADEPTKGEAVFANAKDLKWADAPADLPKGARMVVMYGDPAKAAPYAARLKMPDGYKIAPHWHTQDEQLTVIQGTLVMHMGDTMKAPAHPLEANGYHFLPGKMHHAAESKGETIVQVQGMGPFDIHYLDPADNPNPKAASK
jgi:hypothetical protein